MSASREKKGRQNNPELNLAHKQKEKAAQAARRKGITYGVIAIIAAVLVVILLLWNAGVFSRDEPAAVINGQEYSVEDLSYYYQAAVNEEYSFYYQYAMFGLSVPFDVSQPLSEQVYDAESGKTWQEYFQESALKRLTQTTALCDAANAAGYTLSEAGQSYIDQTMESIKNYAAQNGMSQSSYVSRAYGVSEDVFARHLANYALAMDYQDYYGENLTYDEAALNAYYEENAANLDTYEFRYFYIDGTAPNPTDEEGNALTDENGNTVTATEEEQAAAMADAKEKADAAVAAIEAADSREQAIIDIAPDYVSDLTAGDEDATLSSGLTGTSLETMYSYIASWLKDDSRKTGDVAAIEASSRYYVVLFLDRSLVEDPTVNYSDILVTADAGDADTPTQDALDEAQATCEMILSQWQSGEATAESFSAFTADNATNNSYTYVQPGLSNEALENWLFDSARQAGDTTILAEEQKGWHLIYFQGQDIPYWQATATDAMRTADLSAWLEEITAAYEATTGAGMADVGY